jgi:hypothetical protein
MPATKILLADDDAAVRQMYEAIFTEKGFSVTCGTFPPRLEIPQVRRDSHFSHRPAATSGDLIVRKKRNS